MRVLDLFSGIGGFSLGLRMAGGFETVQFVEIDPWCRKILAKNFLGIPIHDDIRSFRPARGSADVVVGGFPCQPFSVAGQRAGKADDRDLWPEMRRVIEDVRPTWVIGENVAGFVSMELDRSLADLETLGYEATALVIPACAVGAPHRRDRVWILAHANVEGLEGRVKCPEPRLQSLYHIPPQHVATQFPHELPESAIHGAGHGVPRRVDRLRGLGNAVVPQVVAEIGRAIRDN